MAKFVGDTVVDMKSDSDGYVHDSIPWCGLTEAYCMARCGIRPPFKKGSDTDCFLWAESWASDPNFIKLSTPRPGCLVYMTRSGGGHITTFEEDLGSSIKARGGNQSDAITLATFSKSNVKAYVWPASEPVPPGPEPEPGPDQLPVLKKGSKGPSVAYMQSLIPKWIDGDFGSTTESLLKEFQRSKGLEVDGICGEQTWAALGVTEPPPMPEPEPGEWFDNITATMFGGSSEYEPSAYPPNDAITPTELSVALPYRFTGTLPKVEVRNSAGEIVLAKIRDIGPWMIDDNYWDKGTRPIAETCYKNKTPLPSGPQEGRIPSNPAGIDLSEALAKELEIGGMGKVSWRFEAS